MAVRCDAERSEAKRRAAMRSGAEAPERFRGQTIAAFVRGCNPSPMPIASGDSRSAPLLNRVVINLPQQQVSWIDEKVHGIENRTTFLRRLIQQAMESDKRQQPPVA